MPRVARRTPRAYADAVPPIVRALEARKAFRQVVVQTVHQHDREVTEKVLSDLAFPAPDSSISVHGDPHGLQTAHVLAAFEEQLLEIRPDVVLVVGDTNATLACALAASKLGIAIARVDGGLRSFDWQAPEEINRVLTDRLADVLFTSSVEAADNLKAEGIGEGRVYHVGNPSIDSLRRLERRARVLKTWKALGLREREYVLVTLHRPPNIDDAARLSAIGEALERLAGAAPVVFPVHPVTRERLGAVQIERLERAGVLCLEPASYVEFLSLQAAAGAIVTDSATVQEEASALGISCFTVHASTERPLTITHGTNVLLGDEAAEIADVRPAAHEPTPSAIPLWDGKSGERVADALVANYALMPGAAGVH
jgi:UDP-N-acetylglucosamine 2-epimerase (non-hydrolysing)